MAGLVERTDSGGVAVLCLNRPDVLNALSPKLFAELRAHVERLAGETETVGCVVLRGAGRSFSAGNDLRAIQAGERAPSPHFQAETLDLLERLPQPVIASVQGHCYTGALELALACDLLVAAESARFADTHGKWGMTPTWGMSQRLPRRIGPVRAKELMWTGRSRLGSRSRRARARQPLRSRRRARVAHARARGRDRRELLVHAAGREAALPGRRAARPRRCARLRAREQPRRGARHAGAPALVRQRRLAQVPSSVAAGQVWPCAATVPASRLLMRAQDTIEHSPVSDGDTQRRFAAPESAGPLFASAARSGARSLEVEAAVAVHVAALARVAVCHRRCAAQVGLRSRSRSAGNCRPCRRACPRRSRASPGRCGSRCRRPARRSGRARGCCRACGWSRRSTAGGARARSARARPRGCAAAWAGPGRPRSGRRRSRSAPRACACCAGPSRRAPGPEGWWQLAQFAPR